MCEAKPGTRCASDTRDGARAAHQCYTRRYPGGPPVDPLNSAAAGWARATVEGPPPPLTRAAAYTHPDPVVRAFATRHPGAYWADDPEPAPARAGARRTPVPTSRPAQQTKRGRGRRGLRVVRRVWRAWRRIDRRLDRATDKLWR